MSGIIDIGISGLNAAKTALTLASENIANANTPYYARRRAEFSEQPFSNGVSVSEVKRIFDLTADQYAQKTGSDFSEADTYLKHLQNFEPVFDDDETSVGTYLTQSLSALEQLNTDVLSTQGRDVFLGKLASLTTRFQSVNAEIDREAQDVNLSLETTVDQVNNILGSLARINKDMIANPMEDRSQLLDKRDALVHELAKYMNFSAQNDSSGILQVSFGNGVSLLLGTTPTQFSTMTDPNNPLRSLVAINQSGVVIPVDQLITTGQIAGLENFRKDALEPAQRALGRLGLALSAALNSQNKLGMDNYGNIGGDILTDINSSAAIGARVIANSNNTGSSGMTVSITNTGQLSTSDYRLAINAGNTYALTRISDGAVISSGAIGGTFPQAITADGFSLNINAGTFNAGDLYTISPTNGALTNMTLAISDSSKLALGWPVAASNGTKQQGSSGVITVTGMTDTTTAAFSTPKALNPPLSIQFLTGGSYNIVNATTSAVIEGPIAYSDPTTLFPTQGGYDPGYRVSLSGQIQAGDSFNINYNTSAGSNENGLAMAGLFLNGNSNILEDGLTFNQAYNSASSDISVLTNQTKSSYDSSNALMQQAEKMRDEISGVSVEEESMDLSRYQQAYQASAQILQAARSILDTVIQMVRR